MPNKQFITFLIIGVVNTFFGYSIFSLFIYLGLHYIAAAFLATCCGILFNFNTTGKIVFKNANHELIYRFVGVYAMLYIINVMLLWLLHFFTRNMYLAGLIATGLLVLISYNANKHFVFRKPV